MFGAFVAIAIMIGGVVSINNCSEGRMIIKEQQKFIGRMEFDDIDSIILEPYVKYNSLISEAIIIKDSITVARILHSYKNMRR